MHCVNYAKREQEKPLLFKLTLRSRSTLSQARSDTCHELLVAFGPSTIYTEGLERLRRRQVKKPKQITRGKHNKQLAILEVWLNSSLPRDYTILDNPPQIEDEGAQKPKRARKVSGTQGRQRASVGLSRNKQPMHFAQ